jgi:DNA-binding NtrC family response regulator
MSDSASGRLEHPSGLPTILIVDDDELALLTEGEFLELEGYEILTAGNAAAALEAIEAGRPNAIVVDLKLPAVADGLTLLHQIRNHDHTIPIAVVTGHYALDDQTEAEIRGLRCSLAYKPLWVENVLALVRDLLAA